MIFRTFFCFLRPAFGHGCLGHPQSLEYFLIEMISFFKFSDMWKNDPTGKAKLLCLDAAKVFFGSCIQLCYQLILLQCSFATKPSQLLSILSSLLLITRTGFEIWRYEIWEESSKENRLKVVFMRIMKYIGEFLIGLPMLGSSLLFSLGTLTLPILLVGCYTG